jgi:hypothetical protein
MSNRVDTAWHIYTCRWELNYCTKHYVSHIQASEWWTKCKSALITVMSIWLSNQRAGSYISSQVRMRGVGGTGTEAVCVCVFFLYIIYVLFLRSCHKIHVTNLTHIIYTTVTSFLIFKLMQGFIRSLFYFSNLYQFEWLISSEESVT